MEDELPSSASSEASESSDDGGEAEAEAEAQPQGSFVVLRSWTRDHHAARAAQAKNEQEQEQRQQELVRLDEEISRSRQAQAQNEASLRQAELVAHGAAGAHSAAQEAHRRAAEAEAQRAAARRAEAEQRAAAVAAEAEEADGEAAAPTSKEGVPQAGGEAAAPVAEEGAPQGRGTEVGDDDSGLVGAAAAAALAAASDAAPAKADGGTAAPAAEEGARPAGCAEAPVAQKPPLSREAAAQRQKYRAAQESAVRHAWVAGAEELREAIDAVRHAIDAPNGWRKLCERHAMVLEEDSADGTSKVTFPPMSGVVWLPSSALRPEDGRLVRAPAAGDELRRAVEAARSLKWCAGLEDACGKQGVVIRDDESDGTSQVRFPQVGFTAWLPTRCLSEVVFSKGDRVCLTTSLRVKGDFDDPFEELFGDERPAGTAGTVVGAEGGTLLVDFGKGEEGESCSAADLQSELDWRQWELDRAARELAEKEAHVRGLRAATPRLAAKLEQAQEARLSAGSRLVVLRGEAPGLMAEVAQAVVRAAQATKLAGSIELITKAKWSGRTRPTLLQHLAAHVHCEWAIRLTWEWVPLEKDSKKGKKEKPPHKMVVPLAACGSLMDTVKAELHATHQAEAILGASGSALRGAPRNWFRRLEAAGQVPVRLTKKLAARMRKSAKEPHPPLHSFALLKASLGALPGVVLDPSLQAWFLNPETGIIRTKDVPPPDVLAPVLRPYQLTGFRWLVSNAVNGLGCILADDMGLGKTLQAIALILYLKREGHLKRPALVVVPKGLLTVWTQEIGKWASELKVHEYHGQKAVLLANATPDKAARPAAPAPATPAARAPRRAASAQQPCAAAAAEGAPCAAAPPAAAAHRRLSAKTQAVATGYAESPAAPAAPGAAAVAEVQTPRVRRTGAARHGSESPEADVFLTSYGTLRSQVDFLAENQVFSCMILDEAQQIKNYSSKTTKAVKAMGEAVGTCRISLSGTPVENRLSDLHSQFEFILPGYLASSRAEFEAQFGKPLTPAVLKGKGGASSSGQGMRLVYAFATQIGATLLVLDGRPCAGEAVTVTAIDRSDNTVECHVPSLARDVWFQAGELAALSPKEWLQREAAAAASVQAAETRQLFQKIVEPFVMRRLKTDPDIAPDLPDKVERVIQTPLAAGQAALYKAVQERELAELGRAGGGGAAPTAFARAGQVLAMIHALREVCNHPATLSEKRRPPGAEQHICPRDSVEGSGKTLALLDLLSSIAEAGEKAVVFFQYLSTISLVADQVHRALGTRPLHYVGSMGTEERESVVQRFQTEPDAKVLLLSLQAGGVGITLTAAQHVIHFDRCYNPAKESQATDRVHRIGQTRLVTVTRLVSPDTFEERLAAIMEQKAKLASIAPMAGENWIADLDDDELRDLFSLGGGCEERPRKRQRA